MAMYFLSDYAGFLVVLFEDGDFCSSNATERACLEYVRSEIQGDSFASPEEHEYVLLNRKVTSGCDRSNPERRF